MTQYCSKNILFLVLACVFLLYQPSQYAYGSSFDTCLNESFLIQDSMPKLFKLDLSTGYYYLVSQQLGTQDKLNASGFNTHDNYLYAWSYEQQTLIQLGKNNYSQPLNVLNVSGEKFYAGDVAINENVYYAYQNDPESGLYKIDLTPGSPDYLNLVEVASGWTFTPNIFDFAFHPNDGYAYGLSSVGQLVKIDVINGSYSLLSNVGITGIFGAVFFDSNGFFYASRNQDGKIFQMDLSQLYPEAVFFAHGPKSHNSDGARCALSNVAADTSSAITDFGDAPDSYGTRLENNGARHQWSSLFLGERVDAENDAMVYPQADDTTDSWDDEDGVQFVTAMEVGLDAMIHVTSSENGFLNAWADWNSNGSFESNEQFITDRAVFTGKTPIRFPVPDTATIGEQWFRFRLSSTTGLQAIGGTSDGEVEDYLTQVVESNVTTTYFPSSNGWVTLAYEDAWPLPGDYDMNDFVVQYRTAKSIQNNNVIRTIVYGKVASMGANYHNGFAVRLEGIDPIDLDVDNIELQINGVKTNHSPLEENRAESIFIISEDVKDFVSSGEHCVFHRTRLDCQEPISFEFKLIIPFESPVNLDQFPADPYDPFIFASPGYDHGYLFLTPPGRSFEIHLSGQSPTEAFNSWYFGLGVDDSDPFQNRYFVNTKGMPWAVMINTEWAHPLEYIDVLHAYPQLEQFVLSGGTQSQSWFKSDQAQPSNIYTLD